MRICVLWMHTSQYSQVKKNIQKYYLPSMKMLMYPIYASFFFSSSWCVVTYGGRKLSYIVQVNLCQKLLFLPQLTHNMTTDCSMIYEFSTWKFQAQKMSRTCSVHKLFFCFYIQNYLCAKHVPDMFWAWNFHVLNLQINETIFVIFWVSWCKNKCFWKRFTCMKMQCNVERSDAYRMPFYVAEFKDLLFLLTGIVVVSFALACQNYGEGEKKNAVV